jgi:hypothetical protein
VIILTNGCEPDMHFDILVEDFSGKRLLEIIVPKIVSPPHSWEIFSYKGCGIIPRDLRTRRDASKRILLEQLPRLLQGFGRRNSKPGWENSVVIVVVDCDDRNCEAFKKELVDLLDSCKPKPKAFFRIAIEEIEAWLMGDVNALRAVYPRYDKNPYEKYQQDGIIGTWERLADITLNSTDAVRIKRGGYQEIGIQKSYWAENIGKNMNVQHNVSPSFKCFKKKLEELAN